MTDHTKAVFLSYASQDAEAAKRICEALRQAGIEVWFDQSELVGGDAWDQSIRQQISECALFIPVLSETTQARREAYFRLEWKLADERTHLMAEGTPFLLPVTIDQTTERGALVPKSFVAVQWTKLIGGETPPAFVERVKKLLGGSEMEAGRPRPAERDEGVASPRKATRPWLVPAVSGLVAVVALALWQPWRHSEPVPATGQTAGMAKPAAPLSPARQLAEKANAMSLQKYNSTADDFAAAEGLIKQALTLDQNDAEIWAISSQFQTAIRTRGFDDEPARREAARSQAERALKLDPNSTEGLFALGRWQRDNDPDRTVAEKTFLAVLARAPDHEGALGNLGTLYSRQDRVEEALAMFERAARNPATLPLARYSQYLTYFGHRRFEEAERAVRESIAAEPSSNSVSGLAMVLLTAKGDVAGAVAALAAVPAGSRNEHRVVWTMAFAHLAAREPDEALAALRRLSADFVQDNWFTGPTAYWAGRAHAQAGRAEAARIAFESGVTVMDAKLKATPGDPALHVARGELLAWLGRTEDALGAARTATELTGGGDTVFWFRSPVRIYAALGRADEALPLLEKLCARSTRAVLWPLTPALLKIDPLWDKLRGEPRFQALCAEPAAVVSPSPASGLLPPSSPLPVDSKSVAVLAFANLSDDKANEYFSDGISEELLNVLAKIPGLKVSARTSAFYFKGKEVPIPEIAKQLGVAYVVEGSVRKQGDKVRITAQLIKAADGFHVWSDTFTRELKDIFAVQDEIAGLIAKSLKLKLGAGDSARDKSTDLAAWQSYLDGRRAWNLRTMEGYREAETLLQRAIALDARFARAYAALADVWQLRAIDENAGVFSRQWRTLPTAIKSRALIDKALEIDPLCAEAYASLGMNFQLGWQDEPALQAYRRAIELNPNYATAHQWLGLALLGVGRMDETLSEVKQAAELDPLSHRILSDYAKVLNLSGHPGEALVVSRRALAIQPGAVLAVLQEARALAMLGHPLEAVALVEGSKKRDITERMRPETLAILAMARQPEAIRRLIGDVDAMPASTAKFASLVALGRIDEAFAQVESSIIEDGWSIVEAAYGQLFEPIRNDARFKQMIETSGRAEYFHRAQAWRAAHLRENPEAKK